MWNQAAHLSSDIASSSSKKKSTRDGFGEGLVIAGEQDSSLVVLTADLGESTRTSEFAKKFANRFVQVGVAEQNMAGIAAGLALSGKNAFITSFASFNPGRNWDQIRISICYSKANVKIVGSHAGLSVGEDGANTQALEDIAITRVLPNMVVLNPSDHVETIKAVQAAAKHIGPVYIRVSREPSTVFTTQETPFEIGKATVLKTGKHITMISAGPIITEAIKAAQELEEHHGISVELINSPSIKPLDVRTILESARKTRKVLVVEESQIHGGLGSAVMEQVGQEITCLFKLIGVQDTFGESGTATQLWEKYGISAPHIVAGAKELFHKNSA